MPPRKPRLLLDSGQATGERAEGPSPDELRAAAKAAAAKALASGVSTLLAEDMPSTAPAPLPGEGGTFKAPPPRLRSASPVATAGGANNSPGPAPALAGESPTGSASENPLASLLGYTDDDSESPRAANGSSLGAEIANCAPAQQAAAGITAGQAPNSADLGATAQASVAPQQQPGTTPAAAGQGSAGRLPGDSMDDQLADFLADLESSGLLADSGGGEGSGAAADAAPSTHQDVQQAQHEDQAPQQGAAAAHAGQQAADAAGAQAAAGEADGGPAEQRVLGPVEGTAGAGWFLVLDTGSRRQYYWNQQSNEVAWTAPEGSVLPPAIAAAAEAATRQPAAAGQHDQQGSGPQPAAETTPHAAPAGATTAEGAEARAAEDPAAPQANAQALAAAFLAAPTAAVLQAAELTAEQCTEAAGELLDSVPKVVRLAVEAQALSALLLLLAQSQHAAVDAGDVGAAFKWSDFEGTMQMALGALHAQLQALPRAPGALGTSAVAGADSAGSAEGQAAQGAGGAAVQAAPATAAAAGSGPGSGAGAGGGSSEEAGELPPPLPDAAQQQQQQQPAAVPVGHAPLPGLAPLPDAAVPTAPPPEAPPLPDEGASLPAAAAAEHAPDGDAAVAAERRKRKPAQDAAAAAVGGKRVRSGGGAPAAPAAGGRRLAKGSASLINKWQAVAKQVEEEEEAAAAAAAALEDPEARAAALEAQRRREAEEWRLQQLRTGAADDNANFAPVVGDWRERLKQGKTQRQAQDVAAPVDAGPDQAAGPGASSASGGGASGTVVSSAGHDVPDLDALSEGLPPGWRAMWDKTHRRLYFGNLATQLTQWERPE